MLLWFVSGFAALLALLAYGFARRASRRLDQLNHAYWELRYQYGELRARLAQLDPDRQKEEGGSPPANQRFVPLSSLKR